MLINSKHIAWEVESKFIYDENQFVIPNHKMLSRSDNGGFLNICKDSYTPLSNVKFMNTVDKMASITKMDVKGYTEMDGGKKVISYIDAGNKSIAGYDYENYMVLGNSHDYSSGFFMASTNEMLRCQNQFSRLHKGKKFSIQHTSSIELNINLLLRRFESWMIEQEKLEDSLNRWSKVTIDAGLKEALVKRLVNIELGKEDSVSTRKTNKMKDVTRAINLETGELGDNLLGLFQGLTYYTTHILKQKQNVYGNIFGSAATMNNDAYDLMGEIESGRFQEDLLVEELMQF